MLKFYLILGLDLAVHDLAAYNLDDPLERLDSVDSLGRPYLK